jgi:hypothetical protein
LLQDITPDAAHGIISDDILSGNWRPPGSDSMLAHQRKDADWDLWDSPQQQQQQQQQWGARFGSEQLDSWQPSKADYTPPREPMQQQQQKEHQQDSVRAHWRREQQQEQQRWQEQQEQQRELQRQQEAEWRQQQQEQQRAEAEAARLAAETESRMQQLLQGLGADVEWEGAVSSSGSSSSGSRKGKVSEVRALCRLSTSWAWQGRHVQVAGTTFATTCDLLQFSQLLLLLLPSLQVQCTLDEVQEAKHYSNKDSFTA